MNDLLVKIRFMFPSLPRAEKAFAQGLLDNPEAITHMTLAKIARETGSSEATIIRFCKRLGFDGYTPLKEKFIEAVSEGTEIAEDGLSESDTMKDILTKVFHSNVQTLSDTLVLVNEGYTNAVSALLKAEKINFFAVGDAYAAGQLAFMKFSRLGIHCTAYADTMMQYVAAGEMGPEDVAIAISYEGRSKNVVHAMQIAKQMGATTISITKMNKSPLMRFTDIPLYIATSDLTVGRDKVTRRVADQFILDALYLGFVVKSKKDYASHLSKMQRIIDVNKF